METKFTPGQWLKEQADALNVHVFDSQGEDGVMYPLAIVTHGNPVELAANASLIAAAPEMFSVLKAIANNSKLELVGFKGWAGRAAELAIAEATGSKS